MRLERGSERNKSSSGIGASSLQFGVDPGQAFRQRHLERVSLHQALRPEGGFDRRLCAAIFDRGMEVDFHWVTDSIYNQQLQPVELYVTDEL